MQRLALHWQILIAMLLGATLGIALNRTAGEYRLADEIRLQGQEVQPLGMAKPVRLPDGYYWSEDTPDQTLIQIRKAEDASIERFIVRSPTDSFEEDWPDIEENIEEGQVTTKQFSTLPKLAENRPDVAAAFHIHGRSTTRVVGGMSQLAGGLFLRMLKMVSIPLIITSLITGVTGLGRADRLGTMFGRTLLYYVSTSLIAICTGLLFVNVIRPGADQTTAKTEITAEASGGKSLGSVLFEQLENVIPPNPFAAAAEGSFLSIIAFSIAFGVFSILVGGRHAERISDLANACFEVMMRMTMAIIHLAPLGVFFLILSATAGQGAGVFKTLGWYMLTVACALLTHALISMPLILRYVAKRNPWQFAKAMSPALLTAFSSASSNGTLPLTMSCIEERAGVSNKTSSFVLPLGATVNMDGTALYEVVAVLFIAQYNSMDLSFAQQVIVVITALLASIGAAGIPHAGLVMMLIILQAVGLPVETQGLIIAVDRVLDMGRTAVNVWSDSCGAAVVDAFNNEPD